MTELTKAEEQIMQVLWRLEKAFVKDIVEELPLLKNGKKPAYNTVSTIVRILQTKEYVGHIAHGRSHEYYPLISKQDYSNYFLNSFMGKYFGGSIRKMVSFFVEQNNVDLEDIEELSQYLKDKPNPSSENEKNHD